MVQILTLAKIVYYTVYTVQPCIFVLHVCIHIYVCVHFVCVRASVYMYM